MLMNRKDLEKLPIFANGANENQENKDGLATIRETITRLQTKIESLEAKEEAQKELREMTNKKFESMEEQVGEIREMFKVLSSEKKELEVKIGQTIEIVKQVEPSQIAKKINTTAHQISVIEGKIQLLNKQYDSFKKDFDKFRHKLNVFKGEDELIKLQMRVKEDLDDVHKIAHQAGMHASKMENHFIKINEKATAVQNAMNELKALQESLVQLQMDLTKKYEDDGDKSTSDISKKVDELEETVGSLTDLTTETFDQLKKDIATHKGNAEGVDPVEFEKTRKWVAYLVKEMQARYKKK